MSVYSWERLIAELGAVFGRRGEDALRYAFSESNAVYRAVMDIDELGACFDALDRSEFEIESTVLDRYRIGHGDSGFPFPHATSAFHYDRMIVAAPSGTYGAHYDTDTGVRGRAVRLSPVGANQAWPAYGNVAIAGGESGLYRVDLEISDKSWPREQEGALLSQRRCDTCDWMYNNIVGVSFDEGSVLARFDVRRSQSHSPFAKTDIDATSEGEGPALPDELIVQRVENLENVLFSQLDRTGIPKLTWGSTDKFYMVEGEYLAVFRLLRDGRTPFIGKVHLPRNLTSLVSVRTALFGLVFEFDESLLVLTSDAEVHLLEGEPVNWRIFPRSRRYENHLHIMRENCLEILSFNHDAEQDQYKKLIGTRAPGSWKVG
ncbi:MAG: hypothetical protein ACFCUT_08530 [Kiloniellaceae bacterium]